MYIPTFTSEEISNVLNKLTPTKSKATNNNILLSSNNTTYSGNYYGHSLKRTKLTNCRFENAIFDHTSFAGSIVNKFTISNSCKFECVFFEQSIITDILFENGLKINGCNFSHSYIKNAKFYSNEIRSTYFNNSNLIDCTFDNCTIRSTMFDASYMVNCTFLNCNMRNLNVEFATFDNCKLSGTTFSYFQFPYIIGIFKNISHDIFVGKNNEDPIPIEQYIIEINDSIIYFTYLEEYFPLVNLYYAKGEKEIAKNCIDAGIEKALLLNDIRMVENYCKLGQCYNLLTITDIQKILKRVDESVERERNSPLFSILLSKSYQLKAVVSNNDSKSKMEIIVQTNITEDNFSEVSGLCEDIDAIIISLMPNRITTKYELSHNSPFEVCLTCIGLTSDLIGISGFIYALLRSKLSKKRKLSTKIEEYIHKSNEMYIKSIDNQFSLFKDLMSKTSKSKQSEIIEDFRGKIIANANDKINNDFALIISEINQ